MLVRITCADVSLVEKRHKKWGIIEHRFWRKVDNDTDKSKGGDASVLYILVRCLPPALISNWLGHSGLKHVVFVPTSCFLGGPGVSERNPSYPLAVVTGRKAAMTAGDLL